MVLLYTNIALAKTTACELSKNIKANAFEFSLNDQHGRKLGLFGMPNSRKKSSLRLNQDYVIIKFMQLNISP